MDLVGGKRSLHVFPKNRFLGFTCTASRVLFDVFPFLFTLFFSQLKHIGKCSRRLHVFEVHVVQVKWRIK